MDSLRHYSSSVAVQRESLLRKSSDLRPLIPWHPSFGSACVGLKAIKNPGHSPISNKNDHRRVKVSLHPCRQGSLTRCIAKLSETGDSETSTQNDTEEASANSESASLGRRQFSTSLCAATTVAIGGGYGSLALPARGEGLARITLEEKERDRAMDTALRGLKSRVSSFQLPNGMQWIVAERHNAPIVACHTYADVGAADEVDGQTGVAHLLEHLAFKGTARVGTRSPGVEASLLDDLDELFYARRDAQDAGHQGLVDNLSIRFTELQKQADALVVPNEYGALLSRQGGVGLNAQTSQDSTEYFVSLPANKLELWMALESGRFMAPVFRQLYSEKEVVKEERRLRVDNAPLGRFTEAFTETAFPGHAYGRPVIGYPDDFERIGRQEVDAFFRQRYRPSSLTCAVVGDVTPEQVEKFALKYFGGWGESSGGLMGVGGGAGTSRPWRTEGGWEEVGERGKARTLKMSLQATPFYMEGYYRPGSASIDDPPISVLSAILSGSRSSRFYKRLITPGAVLSATSVDSFPGYKHPNLMLLYGIPAAGSSPESVGTLVAREAMDIAANGVSMDEVVPVQKAARASLLEMFGNDAGMAKLLCQYRAQAGSWEGLLQESQFLDAVTPEEVQRVAGILFRVQNRVSGQVRMASPHLPVPRIDSFVRLTA